MSKKKDKKRGGKKKKSYPASLNFTSILWNNIRGEYNNSIETGEFRGVAKAMVLAPGKILLTSLVAGFFGPAAPFAMPLVEFIISKTFNVFQRTIQGFGMYDVSIKKSGLAVLKNPKLITPQKALFKLPDKIELPSYSLIRPNEDQIFEPTFKRRDSRTPSRIDSPYSSRLRTIRLLLGTVNQPAPDRNQLRSLLQSLPKTGSTDSDILYPNWVFTGSTMDHSARNLMSLYDWSQKDQRGAQRRLEEFAASQKSFAHAQKIHQDFMKRSRENAQRTHQAHQDFLDRNRRYNNLSKPLWKK